MKKRKRILSAILAFSMIISLFPAFSVNAYAETIYAEENDAVSDEIKNSGEFYVATPNINMTEGAGVKYAATIKRGGDNLEAASVRLTLLDITAQYGKDYTIEVPDKGFFEKDVENTGLFKTSNSIYSLAQENDGKLDEVNGLDEIAALDKTDEEIQEMYDESVQSLSEDLSGEIQEYVEKKSSETGKTGEEILSEAAEQQGSLSAAFEEATGLKDDSAPMDGGTMDGRAIIGDYSKDKLEELAKQLDSPYIVLDFAEGETEKVIEILPKDNSNAEGNKMFLANLFPESDNAVISEIKGITAVIEDDEEWAEPTVEFAQSVYYPENGFADITIRRDGVLTDIAAVKLTSSDGTAMGGRDYSQVDTTVVFPYGISERTIKVPVRSEYIDTAVNFNLTLSDAQNCTIGENSGAQGIVEKGSESYRETEDSDIRLMESMGVSDVNASNTEALDHQTPYSSSAASNGYARAEGDDYILYTSTTWADKAWTRASWDTKDTYTHYDYDGYQIDWTKESGSPCSSDNEVQIYYDQNWHTVWENSEERWDRTTTEVYPQQIAFRYLQIAVSQNLGYLSRAAKLKIHAIKPILRPFEITLATKPLQYLNENGDYVDNTNIPELEDATQATLRGADEEGSGTAVKFSGEQVTVTTKSKYAYISGLEIINPTNGKSKVIKSGLSSGTTSVSFDLSNSFIRQNLDYINFASNGGNRIKGQFTVQPIFDYYDATVTLHNDERASLALNYGDTALDMSATYMIKIPGTYKFLTAKDNWNKTTKAENTDTMTEWRFEVADDGYYEIVNVGLESLLHIGLYSEDGSDLIYNQSDNWNPLYQRFRLEKASDGNYMIVSKLSDGQQCIRWSTDSNELTHGAKDGSVFCTWELVEVEKYAPRSMGIYTIQGARKPQLYMSATRELPQSLRCLPTFDEELCRWEFIDVGNGYFKIKSVYNDRVVNLLFPNSSGNYAILESESSADSQLFSLVEDENNWGNQLYRIISKPAGLALSKDGDRVSSLYDSNNHDLLKWNVVQVEAPKTDEPTQVPYKETEIISVHKGDTLRFTQSIRSQYRRTYGSSRIRLIKTATRAGEEDDDNKPKYNAGQNSYKMICNSSSVDAYVNYEKYDNEIIVRVAEKDIRYFYTDRGIFTKPYKVNGSYRDYTIVPRDGFSLNDYIEMEAETFYSAYVPVWKPANDQKYYSQPTFYFETKEQKEDNIIYLTPQKSDSNQYAITGTAHYSEISLASLIEGASWRPASGLYVYLDQNRYGISGEDGTFTTNVFDGIQGDYVIYKIEDSGNVKYRTVCLKNFKTEKMDIGKVGMRDIRIVSIGDIKVSAVDSRVPHAGAFVATNANGVENGNVALISDDITRMKATIMNNGSTYTDSDGKERTETVKRVEFVIYDPVTNRERSVVEGEVKETYKKNKMSVWEMSKTFKKDESHLYTSSDKIYIRVTTDRVKGNGKAYNEKGELVELDSLNQTIYPDVYTGYTLATTNTEKPATHDFDIFDGNLDQFLTLPAIGSMNATFLIKGVTLSISELPEGGFRLGLGYAKGIEDRGTDDGGTEHKVPFTPDRIAHEFDKVKTWGRVVGPKDVVGFANGGVYPMFGIYLDFGLKSVTHLDDQHSQETELIFIGGGAMLGALGNFRIVIYGAIGPVPVYFGVDGQLAAYINIGAKRKTKDTLGDGAIEYEDVTFQEIKSGDKKIQDSVLFDFLIEANGILNVYVGAGIAGTFGIRGGASIGASFIYYPTITQTYDINPVGLQITVGLKIWVDLVLLSIPSPTLELANKRFGYYEDIDKLKDDNPSLMSLFESEETSDIQTDEYGAFLRKGSGKDEVWLPDKDAVQLMSTFEKDKTTILSEGGYENASPQLMDIGNGRILLVYIANDTAKGGYDRTSLVYNVYDNGHWRAQDSVKIDPNSTKGDFEPSLCDIGDKILVSWTSRNNGDNRTDSKDYLKGMNVFSTTIDKDTLEIGEIEQLTNDEFYNANPVGLYDEVTGDYAVYYLKSEVTDVNTGDAYKDSVGSEAGANLLTIASPTTNGAKLMCRLHNNADGWVTEKLSDNESVMATGERFVVSKIAELSGTTNSDSPRIIDFDAVSYDGKGVYTYTIDIDNNIDTMADRELYIQIYDFAAHKNHKPIRITNDNLADSEPQLVRNGEQTYLFWRESENTIRYINIANLVTNGLEDNETLKDQNADSDGETRVYEMEQSRVFSTMEDPDMTPSYANYKVFVDKDSNMFIAWTQGEDERDENGNITKTALEVYASAYIKETATIDGVETALDSSWSEGMKLTDTGRYNDSIAVWTDANGNLITVNTQYDIDNASSEATNIKLVSTEYKTVGSAEIKDVRYYDTTPLAGSKDTVTIDVKNNGLKAMNGFTLKAYEVKNGNVSDTPVFETTSNERVTPSSIVPIDFDWQMPDSFDGIDTLSLHISVQETGYDEIAGYDSESIEFKPEYVLHDVRAFQTMLGIMVRYDVENTGNVDTVISTQDDISSTDARVVMEYVDAYGTGAEDKVFLDIPVPPVKVGETVTDIDILDIPIEGYLKYGRLNSTVEVRDTDNNVLSQYPNIHIALEHPRFVGMDNEDIPLDLDETRLTIPMKEGESYELNGSYTDTDYYEGGTVQFISSDPSVASVVDGTLYAVGEGTTKLTATVYPFGGATDYYVTVQAAEQPTPTGHSGGGGSSVSNKVNIDNGGASANGNVAVSKTNPSKGETVTVTVTPDEGYELDKLTVTDKDGNEFEVTKNENGTYTFIMPDGKVTITPVFVKEGGEPTTPPTDPATPPADNDNPFVDVKKGDYFYDAVLWAAKENITSGTTDTTFSPNESCTRGQTVTFLWREAGSPEPTSTVNPFTDVKEGDYFYKAVLWAYENSITFGTADDKFSPHDTVTRGQTVTFLYRMKGEKTNGENPFTDVKTVDYYYDSVLWAYENDITSGTSDTTFSPNDNCLRGQIVTFLYRCNK